MTVIECAKRQQRTCDRIRTVFESDESLRKHANQIAIEVEHARVVLRGELPSGRLINQLIPAIRRAGVLCQVAVQVKAAA
jgi:hypothetical protein